ncbi:MAG TPA: metal-dependent transcriptional regulator [bacterium]|nr:metal-dependent transcriptional regulator [bacterium]HPR89242.1 metal-dependent transcriptional regulator [bacterium]
MDIIHDQRTQEYIEVIHDLEKQNRVARVKDIARARGVSPANVSIALNHLAKKALILHEQYGHVVLTAEGQRVAQVLEKRHNAIRQFMTHVLGLEESLAESEACTLEHILSPESLQAIGRFLIFIDQCPKRDRSGTILFRACGLFGDAAASCQHCAHAAQTGAQETPHVR